MPDHRPAPTKLPRPLRGVRVLSLALNLPGPAALMRIKSMGARCLKVEPPSPAGTPSGASGDPMGRYNAQAYAVMHRGIRVQQIDLKSEPGQARLHQKLAQTDVLLTSFRPSALRKLGRSWRALHKLYPQLSVISVVGAPGTRAEDPCHDLTYLAEAGLLAGHDLPSTLFADMSGALMASEAILKAVLSQRTTGKGHFIEVALTEAASWLAQPRSWGLTLPQGVLGGSHAGYRIYPCEDGRVALAALEPHFAAALCSAAGVHMKSMATLLEPSTHQAVARWLAHQTRAQLRSLSVANDIPLATLD